MDSKSAAAYVFDPLYEPQAHEETGLNAHFRSTFAPPEQDRMPPESSTMHRKQLSHETNPFRKSSGDFNGKAGSSQSPRLMNSQQGYPSPPPSAEPHRTSLGHRRDISGASIDSKGTAASVRSRASSLGERYPGDMSHKPLDVIRRDSKRANRSPHLRKQHIPGPDTIDRLDQVNGRYHHEGPYDAALLARNTSYKSSPVAAVQGTTNEAIRATPRENILDAIERHRPIDGVATVPPGQTDRFGRQYDYQEGDDLMVSEGNYKRWPGLEYHPDDLKGKGEPEFSIDRALKEHKDRGRNSSDGIELVTRQRLNSADGIDQSNVASGREILAGLDESSPRRTSSVNNKKGDGLKKRLNSLRKRL